MGVISVRSSELGRNPAKTLALRVWALELGGLPSGHGAPPPAPPSTWFRRLRPRDDVTAPSPPQPPRGLPGRAEPARLAAPGAASPLPGSPRGPQLRREVGGRARAPARPPESLGLGAALPHLGKLGGGAGATVGWGKAKVAEGSPPKDR